MVAAVTTVIVIISFIELLVYKKSLYLFSIYFFIYYYGPSIISVIVTKGGHLRGNRLYKTSKTIGRGVD